MQEGQRVYFDLGKFGASYNGTATGTVRGLATTELPIAGRMIIVELDDRIPDHPYSCIVVQESWLRFLPS